MPKRGKCALCQKPSLLQLSHLIGKAIYRMSRDRGFDPVVMTPKIATHTQKQVKEYMFCADCEDRFNKGGESYVSTLIYNGKDFPLLDRIKLAPLAGVKISQQNLEMFLGRKLGINTGKLAYYAISLIWRSAAAKWRTLEKQTTTVEMNETRKEEFRQYLLGHTELPHDVGVVATVCTDDQSQGWVFLPTETKGSDFRTHGLTFYAVLVRGIYFRVMVDVPDRFPLQEVCCLRSPDKLIWVSNCVEHTNHSFQSISRIARVAENLKRHLP